MPESEFYTVKNSFYDEHTYHFTLEVPPPRETLLQPSFVKNETERTTEFRGMNMPRGFGGGWGSKTVQIQNPRIYQFFMNFIPIKYTSFEIPPAIFQLGFQFFKVSVLQR